MPSIKDSIYTMSKKISTMKDLDITPEELSALTLYKLMNLPYFEGVNQFLNLSYNIFDEIVLGHRVLNNVECYTNQTIDELVIRINENERNDIIFNLKNTILTETNKQILIDFVEMLKTTETTQDIIDFVKKKEIDEPFYFSNFLNNFKNLDRDREKELLNCIDYFIPYEQEGTEAEKNFEMITKQNQYRGSPYSNHVFDLVFNSYHLKEAIKKNGFKNLIKSISQSDLDTLTGVAGLKVGELSKFETKYPSAYNKSMYKIFKDNKDNENTKMALQQCFDLLLLPKMKMKFINDVKELVINPPIESFMNKYDKEISLILKNVFKKYPQLTKPVDQSSYKIKVTENNTKEEYYKQIRETLRKYPLEIYQSKHTHVSYLGVRGFNHYYKQFNPDKGIYVTADNGLEEVAAVEGARRNSLRTDFEDVKLRNIRIRQLSEGSRTINIETKSDLIEKLITIAKNEGTHAIVFDIFTRGGETNKISQHDMEIRTIMDKFIDKYDDMIFFNDGYKIDNMESVKSKFKTSMLKHYKENDLTEEALIKANRNLESFFKTDEFKTVAEMKYFDLRESNIVETKTEEFYKTKNKRTSSLKVK